MVDDAEHELAGEHLSQHGIPYHETDTRSRLVGAVAERLVQRDQFLLLVYFKVQLGGGVPLVLTRIPVRPEHRH